MPLDMRSIAPWLQQLGPMPQIPQAQPMTPMPIPPLLGRGAGGGLGGLGGQGQLGMLLALLMSEKMKKQVPDPNQIPMLGSTLNPYGHINLDPAGRIRGGI